MLAEMPLHSSFSQIPRPTLSSELGKVVGWTSRFQTQVTNPGTLPKESRLTNPGSKPRLTNPGTLPKESRLTNPDYKPRLQIQFDKPRLLTQVLFQKK